MTTSREKARGCDKIRRRRYIPSFQDRIEVANWWMDNVYVRDKETKIPLGEIESPFLSKQ